MDSNQLSSNITKDSDVRTKNNTFLGRLKSPIGVIIAIMICVAIVCIVMWVIYGASFEVPQVMLLVIAGIASVIAIFVTIFAAFL